MIRLRWTVATVAVVGGMLAGPVLAQPQSFEIGSADGSTSAATSSEGISGGGDASVASDSATTSSPWSWSMPTFSNPFKSTTPAAPTGPSMWQRMGDSTGQFFRRTGELLNPFDDSPAAPTVAPPPEMRNLGVNSVRPGSRLSQPTLTEPAWYDPLGLFTGGETAPPKDVNEFLGRRPAWKD